MLGKFITVAAQKSVESNTLLQEFILVVLYDLLVNCRLTYVHLHCTYMYVYKYSYLCNGISVNKYESFNFQGFVLLLKLQDFWLPQ